MTAVFCVMQLLIIGDSNTVLASQLDVTAMHYARAGWTLHQAADDPAIAQTLLEARAEGCDKRIVAFRLGTNDIYDTNNAGRDVEVLTTKARILGWSPMFVQVPYQRHNEAAVNVINTKIRYACEMLGVPFVAVETGEDDVTDGVHLTEAANERVRQAVLVWEW